MTDDEARALGARWIAAMGERAWRVGMRVLPPPEDIPGHDEDLDDDAGLGPGGVTTLPDIAAVVSVANGLVTVAWFAGAGNAEGGTLLRGDVPDLRDPATRGAALAALREAYGDPRGYLQWDFDTDSDNKISAEIADRNAEMIARGEDWIRQVSHVAPVEVLPAGCLAWRYYEHGQGASEINVPYVYSEGEALVFAAEAV